MEFRLSEARLRELAQIEAQAGCDLGAGGGWDHSLAKTLVSSKRQEESSLTLCIEIYQDSSGRYRWRCKANNGKLIADSTGASQCRHYNL